MKVIVGLGNPGREYALTRHNVGWWLVDHLGDAWRAEAWKRDGRALVTTAQVQGTRVRLVKPQTFMNLSGEALRAYPRRASFTVSRDLLVVVDEVQLPVGRYRFRASGSSGGHNGLKSIEAHLHTRDYGRLRIGVGPPPERARHSALHDYVLDVFGRAEAEAVRALLPELTEGIELWIAEGMLAVMNRFTGKADDRSG